MYSGSGMLNMVATLVGYLLVYAVFLSNAALSLTLAQLAVIYCGERESPSPR